MKTILRVILSAVWVMNIFTVRAQITKAAPEDFKEIKSRPLIIQIEEEDVEFISSQTAKIAKAKEEKKVELQANLDKHKAFVKSFNEAIKSAAQKYWDLNGSVEYKTKKEVEQLRKAKSTKYTVLFFTSEVSASATSSSGYSFSTEFDLPTLNYSRIEKGMAKIDYSFFMPSIVDSKTGTMTEGAFIISFKIMKNHIAVIEKSNKSGYTAKEYGKDQAEANCSKLKGATIYIDKSYLKDNTTESDITNACKNNKVVFVTGDKIEESIKNEEDKIATINIPWGVKAASAGGQVSASIVRVEYMKSLVNTKTGEIYYVNGISAGEMYDSNWRARQMSKIGECK